jgi:hypothetical protein
MAVQIIVCLFCFHQYLKGIDTFVLLILTNLLSSQHCYYLHNQSAVHMNTRVCVPYHHTKTIGYGHAISECYCFIRGISSLTEILTRDIPKQWDKATKLVIRVLSSYNTNNQELKCPKTMKCNNV